MFNFHTKFHGWREEGSNQTAESIKLAILSKNHWNDVKESSYFSAFHLMDFESLKGTDSNCKKKSYRQNWQIEFIFRK